MTMQAMNDVPARDVSNAALRGLRCRCPNCGEGAMFRSFLKVDDYCPVCNEALYHHRADDAPPYVVITIVGHIVVALMLAVEKTYAPELWVHGALWVPLTIMLCLAMLQPVKGALVGVQWGLRMHGFDPNSPEAAELPIDAVPKRTE